MLDEAEKFVVVHRIVAYGDTPTWAAYHETQEAANSLAAYLNTRDVICIVEDD